MKKTMALALAMVLAISLCACGVAVPENVPFTPGSVSGNHYESPFGGVSCDLSSDWTFMTDEQIQQNNEAMLSSVGEDYAQALKNAAVITDMYATYANGMDTVNVTFEKLSGAIALLDAASYADISAKNLTGAFESMGFENVTYEVGTVAFAGGNHASLRVSGTYLGNTMYETIAVVKCHGYMMLVTACTWGEDTTEAVLANFY